MLLGDFEGLVPAAAALALVGLGFLPSGGPADAPSDIPVLKDVRRLALEQESSGSSMLWHDPATGLSGSITPAHVFRAEGGAFCRHYSLAILPDNGGKVPDVSVTQHVACRQADGDWRAEDEPPVLARSEPEDLIDRLLDHLDGHPAAQIAENPAEGTHSASP